MPRSRRELTKLGINSADDLEKPLPSGRVYSVRVVVRTTDNGHTHNEVKGFDYVRTDTDPFAPPDTHTEVVETTKTDTSPTSPQAPADGVENGLKGNKTEIVETTPEPDQHETEPDEPETEPDTFTEGELRNELLAIAREDL